MATADPAVPGPPHTPGTSALFSGEQSQLLAQQLRILTRIATFVAVLSSPGLFVAYHSALHWSIGWSIVATIGVVIAFRGLLDVLLRRIVPWPSLFGIEEERIKEDDVVNRHRASFWRFWYRILWWLIVANTTVWALLWIGGDGTGWFGAIPELFRAFGHKFKHFLLGSGIPVAQVSTVYTQVKIALLQAILPTLLTLPLLFIVYAGIFIGPLLIFGYLQMKAYEPGDATWGVKLDDVRGQADAKGEVTKIVSLWQSGEQFEESGGKRERGMLLLGQPGTGKTMLAKAIATGFNCPIVTMPGSGFVSTFVGIDAILVRVLAAKAKRLARKWGGQCIVFIDEIDAIGTRRSALASFTPTTTFTSAHDDLFFGPRGALTPSGDIVFETRAWRERLFAARSEPAVARVPGLLTRTNGIVWQVFGGGMGGNMGQTALNQLLVVMDGIDAPPFMKAWRRRKLNLLLNASYLVPRRLFGRSLRMRPSQPRKEQIYFIGATNVSLEALDPALVRAGRMGRHVRLRTPAKQDRLDILDLYMGKVDHMAELDTPKARDELARLTMGYSPADIEQACSLALTYAYHNGRGRFAREDIVEAMTVVESGAAAAVEYMPEERRAVAIHEAGHAVAAHVWKKEAESVRISIRMRGGSLGHHYAIDKDERFSSWKREEIADIVWYLGAMAAEKVFYDETSTGVGGDLYSATVRAARMVGVSGMAPNTLPVVAASKEDVARERKQLSRRCQGIGAQLLQVAESPEHQPVLNALRDGTKRAAVTEILGQAFVYAYNTIRENRDAVERLAEELVEKREIYG
ncbi:MAG: AAA family ATPase, partial [Gaiellaceae bacterium]